MFPGFGLLLRLISRRQHSRADENQLRQELLAHQRRQLLHARIPNLDMARQEFGSHLNSLVQVLIQHDPAGLEADAEASPLYPELARTLLYQLPKAATPEQRLRLLQQELYLWFGRQAPPPESEDALTLAFEAWCRSGLRFGAFES
ncbi:hypothetical protein [Hymenobacter pini]|uniref:hypothetical protein n=1 Tax=Hymenobacter pini TaxID=2880879 RepID=UPI001CF0DB4B|nr:hypothetical protein [Hymenobacter pini]MCA8830577.1 hypothetical protein [Hymenobacter pini]